ncbi:hypothetical protein [Sphingobium sp.]|uniref:hypothetical protein n=1 Tax=Sphingobium sp. TaxID=1912891 RepID=UPI0026296BA3|nr:hypothetical protein [Sphingobium sp.]|tara:strand:- start:379 stop:558 length:180 start_codon:yes stop_codon:yes gene_type:complete
MTRETDVNYLLLRQQMSMARAQSCPSRQGRAAYEGLARGYSDQIDAYRRTNVEMVERAH